MLVVAQQAANALAIVMVIVVMATIVAFPSAFWLWMLIDCASNEPPEGRERVKWLVAIVIFGPFGALAYFAGRRKKRLREFGR
jgi:hypothetical protein